MNDFIDDFILEYKNQPCLWQASSVNFKNRKKRQEAYMKLIEIAAKHGEQYNVERTKQKINNLRCAFRHQLKKYTECKNNKGGKEEPYCPKRKYFESLMFLMDEEKPTNRANITDKLKEITVTKISVKKDSNQENKKVPEDGGELVKLECSMNMITEALEDHETQTHVEEQEIETSQIIEEEAYLEDLNSEDVSAQDDPNNFNNSNNTNELQIECDEEVNILWPRSSCETKTAETIPINVVSVQTPVVLPQQKRLKQKPIIQHQQLIQKANVIKTSQLTPVSASIHRVGISPSSSIITTHGTTPTSTTFTLQSLPLAHQQTISIPVSAIDSNIEERQRSVSHSSSVESSQYISTVHSDNQQQPPCKKIKVDCTSSNFEKLLSLACSRINCSDSNEDDYSIFGKMVAYKLRSMDRQQSLIAEKIITDILLEGQMKLLNYTHDQPQQQQQQSLSTMNRVNLTIPIRNNPSNSYVISEINNGTADVIHTSVPQ